MKTQIADMGKTGNDTTITLAAVPDLASRNKRGVVDVAPGTIVWWRTAFRSLMQTVGDITITDLNIEMVEMWYDTILETLQTNSANSYVAAIKCAYSRLIRLSLVNDNPARHIQLSPPDPHIPAAATVETYQTMRARASRPQRALVSFLWGTGCRIAEACQLRMDRFEFWYQDKTLCMAIEVLGKHHRRRPERARRVVYADGVQAQDVHWYYSAVKSIPGREFLFMSRDGTASAPRASLLSMWYYAVDKCQFEQDVICNPHSFRHAFAYRKRAEGYPLEWISQWLGHSDPQFTAKFYGDKTEHESRRRFFKPPPVNLHRI